MFFEGLSVIIQVNVKNGFVWENMNMRKLIFLAAALIMAATVTSCSNDSGSESTAASTQASPHISGLDRSRLSTDLMDCDCIGSGFSIAMALDEVWNPIKDEVKTAGNVWFEVTSVSGVTNIVCRNSNKMDALITEVKKYAASIGEPRLTIDLDGSGVKQTTYYVIINANKDVRVYISGAGKDLADLLNDKAGDGVYQCRPEVCDEYKM